MLIDRIRTPLVWSVLATIALVSQVVTAAPPAKRPNQPPTVRITSAGHDNSLIAPATISITAEASDEDGSVKSVKFFAGAIAIGNAANAPFRITWNDVPAGVYALTAVATDNSGASTTSAPVRITVIANRPPTVRITSPVNGATYTAPALIALTAEASDTDGKIARVRFFVDGHHLGGRRHAPYTETIRHVAAGTYKVTAVATDNLGAETTSNTVSIVVAPNAPPTVAITSPSSGQKFVPGNAIAISASAGDSGGGSIRAVRFFADSVAIGTATQAPYTVTWLGATLGPHTLTAAAIDNAGLRTTSAPVAVTVAAPDPGPDPDPNPVPPSTLPLVQSDNLVYQGSFRLPSTIVDNYGNGFGYGGGATAFNPARDSLFVVGHDSDQNVAEVGVPSIINSTVIGDLATAPVLQPFAEITEGKLYTDINPGDPNAKKIGGILPYQGRLYVTGFAYYDGNDTQVKSHFVTGMDFSVQGDVDGPYQVGTMTVGAGFVSGYLGRVPANWQDAFGGPVVTGNCCLPIISRTSYGPALFTIDPTQLGLVDPLPATPLVYYPIEHHTLGDWDQQSTVFNGATEIKGVVFPEATRTVLFFGRQGLGPFCYGIGGEIGGDCYDPADPYKGDHAYPYVYYVWAYDANDLAAVKRGEKQPWEIAPYAYWPLPLPFTDIRTHIEGAGYDPATNRIFVSQSFGDGDQPVIHVFSVRLP
jgi:Bacterial Ig domain